MKPENETKFAPKKNIMNYNLRHYHSDDSPYLSDEPYWPIDQGAMVAYAENYITAILESIIHNRYDIIQDNYLDIFLRIRAEFTDRYSALDTNDALKEAKNDVKDDAVSIIRDVLEERIASKGGNPMMIEWFMSENTVNKVFDKVLFAPDSEIEAYVRGINELINEIILIGNPRLLKETSADNFSQLLSGAHSNIKNTFDVGGAQEYQYLADKENEAVDNIRFDGLVISYIAILTNRIMSGSDSQLEEAALKFAAVSKEYKKRYGEHGFKDSVTGIIDSRNVQMCIDTIRNHFRQYITNNNIFDKGNLKNLFDKLISIQNVPDIESEISSYFNCISATDLCVKEPY